MHAGRLRAIMGSLRLLLTELTSGDFTAQYEQWDCLVVMTETVVIWVGRVDRVGKIRNWVRTVIGKGVDGNYLR